MANNVNTAMPAGGGAPPKPPPAAPCFRFAPRRARLDWRLLGGLDVDEVARESDLDALEGALDTVAFGDVTLEDPRNVSGAREGGARRRAGQPAGRGRRQASSVLASAPTGRTALRLSP